jgi:hypothetical protein
MLIPPIVDAALCIARMYALNNDEHMYEGCSCIQLAFYIWAFRETALTTKAVRISVRKKLLHHTSVEGPIHVCQTKKSTDTSQRRT